MAFTEKDLEEVLTQMFADKQKPDLMYVPYWFTRPDLYALERKVEKRIKLYMPRLPDFVGG